MSFSVEIPWLLDDGRDVRQVTVSGVVDGASVASFSATDLAGRHVAFPAEHLKEAKADLVDAAVEMWRTP